MSISADLLSILACPSADHAPLRLEVTGDGEQLVCTSCLSRFPISDGIPVLLADEAVPGPRGLGNAAEPASQGDAAQGADSAPQGDSAPQDGPTSPADAGQQPGTAG